MFKPAFKSMLIMLAALLLLCLSVRIFYAEQKYDLFVDETFSITLSEYNHYGWDRNFDAAVPWDGQKVKQAALWNDPTLKGALSDLKNLWQDNRDSPHTNLYYSLLRLWHTGYDGNTDLKSLMYRGISLNFIFFILAFGCAAAIGYQVLGINKVNIAKRSWYLYAFLALAFLNPISISTTLFIRPYAMQEACILSFILCLLKAFITLNRARIPVKLKLNLSFTALYDRVKSYAQTHICFLLSVLLIGGIAMSALALVGHQTADQKFKAGLITTMPALPEQPVIADTVFYGTRADIKYDYILLRALGPFIKLEPDFEHLSGRRAYLQSIRNVQFDKESQNQAVIRSAKALPFNTKVASFTYQVKIQPKAYLLIIALLLGTIILHASCVCGQFWPLSLSFKLTLTALLCLLSGYFALPLLLMLLMIFSGWGLYFKRTALTLTLSLKIFITALIICPIAYLGYFNAFSGDRGMQAAQEMQLGSLSRHLLENTLTYLELMQTGLPLIMLAAALIALIALKMIKPQLKFKPERSAGIVLGLTALLWGLAVIYISPLKQMRYLAPGLSLIALLPVAAAVLASERLRRPLWREQIPIAFTLASLILTIYPAAFARNIDYLDSGFRRQMESIAANSPNLSWVIYMPTSRTTAYFVPFFADQDRITFTSHCKDLPQLVKTAAPVRLMMIKNYPSRCAAEGLNPKDTKFYQSLSALPELTQGHLANTRVFIITKEWLKQQGF